MLPAVICVLFIASLGVNCAPDEDKITNLPGLSPAPHFNQYSGYLDGVDENKLHYW